jgi:hypothetical protein
LLLLKLTPLVITAAKITLDQAMEAERRLNVTQNELSSLNTQREQIEADVEVERKRRDQIRGESDDARKGREKLDADAAMLRQQVETLNPDYSPTREIDPRRPFWRRDDSPHTRIPGSSCS